MGETMSVKSENNKRIAKNTFLLYFRMLFTMGVSLYTSRVVLNTLGVEDFGIYNVVGGVVVMFSFLNSSLATATQRFLNYEMGQGNALKLEKVFSIALTGHYLIALSVILLAETIGLWFVSTQLEIPAERMHAALWVYQFSILTLAVSIISVPYNAVIIAHERMKVFAYVSIAEVSLKLTVVFLLVYLSFDKLVLYAFLLLVVAVIVRMIYATYCKRNFTECKYRFIFEKDLFAQMFCFSGWMFTGTLSNLFSSQGVNILINMFFGPIQNAARGIAYQIQGTVNAFVTNFMVAVQPQIVKSYSQGNYSYMYKLVFMASRYSFYLLFLLSLPVLLQTQYLLQLWLKNVPDYSVLFTQLVVIDLLINSSFTPIASVAFTSGKIRNYQLVVSAGYLLTFALTLLFYQLGFPSYVAFVVAIIISFIGLFARLYVLRHSVHFPSKKYIHKVFLVQAKVGIIAIVIPAVFVYYASPTFFHFAITVLISSVSIAGTTWCWGLGPEERLYIRNKIRGYFHRKI